MPKPLQTILSIDDDDDIRLIGQMLLKKKGGLYVVTHNSGQTGIEYLSTLSNDALPDLILLDVMMPGMDGPQTLEKLQAHTSDVASIPVIFLTAKCQPEEVERLIDLGAAGVVGKPFDAQNLVGQLLNIWNSLPENKSV